jgi:two-component sensor histidine kinase
MQIGFGDANSDDRLRHISQHVLALASIHDLLTQREGHLHTDSLSSRALLSRLIPMLEQTSGGRIITTEVADVLLPMQKAASLSLLVSECVSNAVKHTQGDIEVSLRVEGGNVHLAVRDFGSGFPPGFDWRVAANTGLTLIDGTARYDLRGDVRFENHEGGGGQVSTVFPVPDTESEIDDPARTAA